jgi:hypothetical protein
LGVEKADPVAYSAAHAGTLLKADELPTIATEIQNQHNQNLAANDNTQYYLELEGDIHGNESCKLKMDTD